MWCGQYEWHKKLLCENLASEREREKEKENSACLLCICWAKSIETLLVCIYGAYSSNMIVISVLSCQSTHIQTHCKRQLYIQYAHTHAQTRHLDMMIEKWRLNLMKSCQKRDFYHYEHIILFFFFVCWYTCIATNIPFFLFVFSLS